MTEMELMGKRARMYSDLTQKLADARRQNDEDEVTIKQLQNVILFLMSRLEMAVVLTDEELEKAARKYDLKLFPNIRNELVIKAERKRNPHGNADSESATIKQEVAI